MYVANCVCVMYIRLTYVHVSMLHMHMFVIMSVKQGMVCSYMWLYM